MSNGVLIIKSHIEIDIMNKSYFLILILIFSGCITNSDDTSELIFDAEITGLESRIIRELKIFDQQIFAATDQGLFRMSLTGDSEWESLGLDEYYVSSFVKDNNRILAAANNYMESEFLLMLSEDDGKTWEPVDSNFGGETPEAILGLAMDENTSKIFASGPFVVASSEDDGKTWEVLEGSWGATAAGLGIIAYNSLNGDLWSGGQNSIEEFVLFQLNTVNNTSKFHRLLFPSPSSVTKIVFDPLDSKRILIGAEAGITETLDGGDTWVPIYENHEESRFFFGLEFAPDNNEELYTAGWLKRYEEPQPLEIYKTINSGASWDTLRYFQDNADLFGGVWSMTSNETPDYFQLYLGLYKGGVVRVNLSR